MMIQTLCIIKIRLQEMREIRECRSIFGQVKKHLPNCAEKLKFLILLTV
ncbi:hypothetical protein SPFL3102_03916 [Sporomusaceae bacterium FL31]|nr:hypothetical protein SPFL3102_03916 [Sporomusaceae bacterium]